MDRVAIYLRKSRKDIEAEERGEGETLSKHKKALLALAKKQGLNIVAVRHEIASGESLIHRPQMMELLREVESGLYNAVVVMDMDRLGRGNMQEQGLILEAFRKSGTKIITPRKTYDLQNEWDEEYSEFEAFMARKEFKLITRRLQGGRTRSLEEGNYIASTPPYGYRITKDDIGPTLEPDPEEAEVVKMIFDWYTADDPHERMGTMRISRRLNELGVKPRRGKQWATNLVLNILKKSSVYTGLIQWKKVDYQKSEDGIKSKTNPREEWIEVQGRHEPLIDKKTAQKAQEFLQKRTHPPYRHIEGIKNPLAGILKCGKCGRTMVRQSNRNPQAHILCINQKCNNKGTRYDIVETRLLTVLQEWLQGYKQKWEAPEDKSESRADKIKIKEQTIQYFRNELATLEQQKERLHDFLERGIYDDQTFIERSTKLANRIGEVKAAMEQAQQEWEKEKGKVQAQSDIIPNVEHVLGLYPETEDPKLKNALLKSILERVEYTKERHQKKDQFTLEIFPKLKGEGYL